jgi:hypothetical protein
LSFYQLVLFGGTAAGSTLAGVCATAWGAGAIVAGACVLVVLSGLSLLVWRLPSTEGIGRDIIEIPGVTDEPRADGDDDAHVLVLIRYTIPRERREAFLAVMAEVAQTRFRTGARQWGIFAEVEDGDVLVETYTVGSWREHVSQHEGRTTEYDGELISSASSMSTTTPSATHLLSVAPPRRHGRLRRPHVTTEIEDRGESSSIDS